MPYIECLDLIQLNPPLCKGGSLSLSYSPEKGGSDFSHKKEGVSKIEGLFLNRRYYLLLAILTIMISNVILMCLCFAHLHYFCKSTRCFAGTT